MKQKRIVFATSNEGKMKETRAILADLNIPVISMKEAGINIDVEETGFTYEENAVLKAKAVHELLPDDIIIADDSGLEVAFLNDGPGVLSARYLGDAPYSVKCQSIIDRMVHVAEQCRNAKFVCAVVVMSPDSSSVIVRSCVEGRIANKMSGTNGFAYDPIFIPHGYDCTSAELDPEQKNEISHRGKALRKAKEFLPKG